MSRGKLYKKKIEERRLKWYGYTKRMRDERLPRESSTGKWKKEEENKRGNWNYG